MTTVPPFEFDPAQTALRLGAAVLFGGIIGFNRDLHGKPAGMRTHAIVALGARWSRWSPCSWSQYPTAIWVR